MSRYCHYCGAALVSQDSKFCSECGKAQTTNPDNEANNITVAIADPNPQTATTESSNNGEIVQATEEKKQAVPLDIDINSVSPINSIDILDSIDSKKLKIIEGALSLDKEIRTKKKNDIDVSEQDKLMRGSMLTRMTEKVEWWKKDEPVFTARTANHYVFNEILDSLESVFKACRNKNDSMITPNMMQTGDRGNVFTCVGLSVCCIVLIFFGVAIWASVEPEPMITINALWIMFGIFACAFIIVVVFAANNDSTMAKYKKDFEKELIALLQERIDEINAMASVSEHIYIMFFDEFAWNKYIADGNEAKALYQTNNSSESCIVCRLFVIHLDCKGTQSLNNIPKGTIYSK